MAIATRNTPVELRDAARDVNKTVGETTGVVRDPAIARDTASAVTRGLPKSTRSRQKRSAQTRRQIKVKVAKKGKKKK